MFECATGKQVEEGFPELKFRFSWRPYQKRVLEAIWYHLDDQRLHVVAAPGAGKTVLGLEAFRCLGKRAVVLAPTRIIRDQWIQRLSDFCETDDPFSLEWVSRRLDQPGLLTSVTYQALHAKSRVDDFEEADGEEDESVPLDAGRVVEIFQTHGVEVIILDEAHHLRAEWWKVLDQVCSAIPELVIVALTATPPYDSEGTEWGRYQELCGPIDEEISVPELVKAGTLCPHQDYIWAVDVSPTERKRIAEYDDCVKGVLNHLMDDEEFCSCVLRHPWLTAEPDAAQVYREPKAAMALLVFQKHKTGVVAPDLCALLDIDVKDVPPLTRSWWQVLLESVLFLKGADKDGEREAYVSSLKKRLRSLELLRNRELSIVRSQRLERSLGLSTQKIQACLHIHKLELSKRGDGLRQVILTDYIRDESITMADSLGTGTLGAWPIFKQLCSASPISEEIALLTGRLCILHERKYDALVAVVGDSGISCAPFECISGTVKVTAPLNKLTNGLTALLVRGDIKTLVGTGSLLGEGWDAPVVNSLILASSVGTYMLTNQMRGRAIRRDHVVADKISSIWHLVAVDVRSESGFCDLAHLSRRFDTFVGLSASGLSIESGFKRMDAVGLELSGTGLKTYACFANNRQMVQRYRNLEEVGARWDMALSVDEMARVIPSVETERLPQVRSFHLVNTLRHLLFRMLAVLGWVSSWGLYFGGQNQSIWLVGLGLGAICMFFFRFKETVAAVRIGLLHLPVDGALRQIGTALCRALCEAGLIETGFRRLNVISARASDGGYYLSLSGGTYYESSLFANCLSEILGPIDHPRYLVIRSGTFLGRKRDDYHAVPAVLGAKKELAKIFYRSWARHVGPSDLIYTRSEAGRAELIHAKARSFTAAFKRQTRKLDRWQS
jgi:superfamily II DNA or RNA helicase